MTDERSRRRLWVVGSLAIAAAAIAYLAFGGLGENLVYYWTPTELEAERGNAVGATVRLGGQVAAGTVVRETDGLTLHFGVTDGTTTVPVTAKTVPPAMFREGIGVVLEGSVAADGSFETRRLMVKHDNEYQAPEEGSAPDLERLVESLETADES